jgi:hypothetical protein
MYTQGGDLDCAETGNIGTYKTHAEDNLNIQIPLGRTNRKLKTNFNKCYS